MFPYGQVYAGDQVLKTVVTSGTGTAADYGCPAAGKTGTSENLADAWFVGYTPQLSTAVWVGYPQGNVPMANGFGGTLAAPIWHDYMSSASNGYCGDFPTPTVRGRDAVLRQLRRSRATPSSTRTTNGTHYDDFDHVHDADIPHHPANPGPTTTGPPTGGGDVGAPPGYRERPPARRKWERKASLA